MRLKMKGTPEKAPPFWEGPSWRMTIFLPQRGVSLREQVTKPDTRHDSFLSPALGCAGCHHLIGVPMCGHCPEDRTDSLQGLPAPSSRWQASNTEVDQNGPSPQTSGLAPPSQPLLDPC